MIDAHLTNTGIHYVNKYGLASRERVVLVPMLAASVLRVEWDTSLRPRCCECRHCVGVWIDANYTGEQDTFHCHQRALHHVIRPSESQAAAYIFADVGCRRL